MSTEELVLIDTRSEPQALPTERLVPFKKIVNRILDTASPDDFKLQDEWQADTGGPVFAGLKFSSEESWLREFLIRFRANTWMFSGESASVLHNVIDRYKEGDRKAEENLHAVRNFFRDHFERMIQFLPEKFIYQPPLVGGEAGFKHQKYIINFDVVAYQERVALLFDYGVLQSFERKERSVYLEIGSGYGALASYFRRTFPSATIVLVDLPYSLTMAAFYFLLQEPREEFLLVGKDGTLKPSAVNLLLPSSFINIASQSVDLAVNTLSMAEMPQSTVSFYCKELTRLLSDRGVFFEQNADNRHLKFGNFGYVPPIVSQFFNRRCQYQRTNFRGAASLWYTS